MGSNSTTWTEKENKRFEDALADFDKNSPERWNRLARAVGGKTVEEVKCHYQKLAEDLDHIENGKVPLPNYKSYAENGKGSYNKFINDQEQRLKYLKLQ